MTINDKYLHLICDILPKAAEYFWAMRKFAADADERKRHLQTLLPSALFREHLFPVLRQYGKFKHRVILRLLAKGHLWALRFW